MDWYILMILTYTTDIGKMSELTLGQGHKFKGQGQICAYLKNGKKYLKSTDWHMLMIPLTLVKCPSWPWVKVTR